MVASRLDVALGVTFFQQSAFDRIEVTVDRCPQVGNVLGLLRLGVAPAVGLTVLLVDTRRNGNAGRIAQGLADLSLGHPGRTGQQGRFQRFLRGDVVDVVLRFEQGQPLLRAHPMRSEAELATLLVERTLRDAAQGQGPPIAQEVEQRPGARYIDFLIPGLIGLNLLGAGMWGVGFNLVLLRTQHLLRRLSVAPMRKREFLLGYLLGRFVLVVPEAAAIVLFGVLLWDVPLRGSLLALAALVVVGGFAFASLGFLLAARAKTIDFTAAYVEIEATYLVPAGSPLKSSNAWE